MYNYCIINITRTGTRVVYVSWLYDSYWYVYAFVTFTSISKQSKYLRLQSILEAEFLIKFTRLIFQHPRFK